SGPVSLIVESRCGGARPKHGEPPFDVAARMSSSCRGITSSYRCRAASFSTESQVADQLTPGSSATFPKEPTPICRSWCMLRLLMRHSTRIALYSRAILALAIFTLGCAVGSAAAQSGAPTPTPHPCPIAKEFPAALRIPAKLQPGEPFEFEKQVLAYLSTLDYRKLGWCEDKWVRDTGPLIKGADAIVHPPVRVFYSKEVSDWLL